MFETNEGARVNLGVKLVYLNSLHVGCTKINVICMRENARCWLKRIAWLVVNETDERSFQRCDKESGVGCSKLENYLILY